MKTIKQLNMEPTAKEFKRDLGKKSEAHPAQRPIELVEYYLKNSSKQGDIVLDLFGGSGSTLIAAEQTKRTCYMMELDPIYCSAIIERWEKLTKKSANKVND